MKTKYDSTEDTKKHIGEVWSVMTTAISILVHRKHNHDASKLKSPEKEMFDKYTPLLKELTYGSPEYIYTLKDMQKEALTHHYENNRHHPEHYKNGVDGMSLFDLIEMFCDWKAATKRHADGDLKQSLEQNRLRFGFSDQLYQIFVNTVNELDQ